MTSAKKFTLLYFVNMQPKTKQKPKICFPGEGQSYSKEERRAWYYKVKHQKENPSLPVRLFGKNMQGVIKELNWPWYLWAWVIFLCLFLVWLVLNHSKVPFYFVGVAMWGSVIFYSLKDSPVVLVKSNYWQTTKNIFSFFLYFILIGMVCLGFSPFFTFLFNYLINPMHLINPQ